MIWRDGCGELPCKRMEIAKNSPKLPHIFGFKRETNNSFW